MDWRGRISVDPNICHGRVCINGSRVMVSVILDNLAAGESPREIMQGYHVERKDIEAVRLIAVESETRMPRADGTAFP